MDDLRTILNYYFKDELRDLGQILGLGPFKLTARKSTMVEAIAGFLLNDPERWLQDLTEWDLNLLRDSISAGKEKMIKLDFNPLPSALERIHAIDVHYDDDHQEVYAIVPDVYDVIRDKVDKVIADKQARGSFKLDRMILSILNFYGVVPFKVFLDSLEELRAEAGFRDILVEDLSKSHILLGSRTLENHQLYLVSPYINDPVQVLDLRRKNRSPKGARYAKIDVRRALEADEMMPFGTYGVKSDEGRAVLEMLHSLGYSDSDSLEELHDIWLNAQFPMQNRSTELLFASVDDIVYAVGKFEQYEDCVNKIAAYANKVPKWLLRGFSADETGTLKVDIQVEENDIPDPLDGLPDYMRKDLPRPDSTTDVSKYGIAIKRVGLNDPCPCGSGLTYGRCHGKHIN
jgi:hypothetical protein